MKDQYEQMFFDKSDNDLHKIIFSGEFTDRGLIEAALEEQKYRTAIKNLKNLGFLLNPVILKLIKRESIFPDDVNRRIRDEAAKRKLIANKSYNDVQNRNSIRNDDTKRNSTNPYSNTIYQSIRETSNRSSVRSDDGRNIPPPTYNMNYDQRNKQGSSRNSVINNETTRNNTSNDERYNFQGSKNDSLRGYTWRNTKNKKSNDNWKFRVGKYIFIFIIIFVLLLFLDIPQSLFNSYNVKHNIISTGNIKPIDNIESKVYLNDGKLTRTEAEKIIKGKFNLPGNEVKDLNLGYENEGFTMQSYDKLANEGLIRCNHYLLVIESSELTDEGKKYAIGSTKHDNMNGNDFIQVKFADLDFGQITGIVEQDVLNAAEVKYTLVRKNITPFGRAFDINEGSIDKSITFTRYDDGWKINKSH
jgi:hypothetical protein